MDGDSHTFQMSCMVGWNGAASNDECVVAIGRQDGLRLNDNLWDHSVKKFLRGWVVNDCILPDLQWLAPDWLGIVLRVQYRRVVPPSTV